MKRLLLPLLAALPAFAQCPTGTLYPGALDTNSSLTIAKNNIVTTLTVQQQITDTVLIVTSTTGWVANMMATVDNGTAVEYEFVNSVTGMNTLNVSRACEGSTAVVHLVGVSVANVASAYSGHTSVAGAAIAVETAIGANLSNIPGTSSGPTVPVNKGGTGVTSAQGNGTKVQLSTGTTTTNDCVKFDANGNTVDNGSACSNFALPSGTQTQYLQIKPNTGNNTTTQFNNLPTASTGDYNFPAQTPGGSLSIGTNTITLTPCPLGVNGTDANHFLYISSGVGTAEGVPITGGTCTSGLSSGTVIVTAAGTHTGAWTIQSASTGIRECFIAQGPGKACYTPAGTWNFYATLYDDQDVAWFGDGVTSIIQQQFNGNGIIIGPAAFTNSEIYVANLFGQYGFGLGSFATSGALWTFRNLADGSVSNIGSILGWQGFVFSGSIRVRYNNLFSNSNVNAYVWSNTANGNAGFFANLYGTVQNNGTVAVIQPTVQGLSITNFLWEAASGSTGTSGLFIQQDNTGGINELQISNGNVDNMASIALTIPYFASSAQQAAAAILIQNVRFTNSGTSTSQVANINSPVVALKFANCTFFNSGTGDGITISGNKRISIVASNIDVNAAGGRPLVIQAGTGAEVVQDLEFASNMLGFAGATPTNAIVTDGSVHNRLRFVGNKINGGIGGFSATTNTVFDRSNEGLPINAVASAATLPFPPFPDITVTGVTGVTAVSGLTKGSAGTLITAAAGFTFTAGATIGNTCTIVTNKLYNWQFDGVKLWLAGNGC